MYMWQSHVEAEFCRVFDHIVVFKALYLQLTLRVWLECDSVSYSTRYDNLHVVDT